MCMRFGIILLDNEMILSDVSIILELWDHFINEHTGDFGAIDARDTLDLNISHRTIFNAYFCSLLKKVQMKIL